MSTLKQILKDIIPEELLSKLKTSYDILGDVAIIEVPEELESYEIQIAKAIVTIHKSINVVAKKTGAVSGDFRIRPLKIILCLRNRQNKECNTETIMKENGIKIKLDPANVFYSIRLGTERNRIAEMVKDGENVLVMFAGVGPFALVIAKQKKANIVAVEWNPNAIKYMEENIKLNKKLKGNIQPILGDVRKVIPDKFKNWANRIVMPLPKTADDFLDVAIMASKNNALIHTYTFMDDRTWKNDLHKWLEDKCMKNKLCNKFNVTLNIVSAHVVRPYAPHIVQIGIILKVIKNRKTLNN